MRVGVFDSGLGGLSVLRRLVSIGSGEIVYIGDSARAPYGNKDVETLMRYTEELLEFLKSKNVDVFVNACNSLSTLDTDKILNKLNIEKGKYFDMISCTQKNIDSVVVEGSDVLIYATVATINSGAYQNILNKKYKVSTLSSVNLAGAIENNNESVMGDELDLLYKKIKETEPEYLFLACTHYPLIQDKIESFLKQKGVQVKIIDPSIFVKKELESILTGDISVRCFTTKITSQLNVYLPQIEDVKVELTSLY